MAEPKPFASLSSGLLARKGGAKPAMRPQSFGQLGSGLEDLGWNDMGHAQSPAPSHAVQAEHVPSSIAALTPAPRHHAEPLPVEDPKPPVAAAPELVPPPVVEQQRAVAAAFADEAQSPAQPMPQPAPRRAPSRRERKLPAVKNKAAFTLRLDAERHLKLRLACAVSNRSAQHIVTEALDKFLRSLPELDAIANQVPVTTGGHRQ